MKKKTTLFSSLSPSSSFMSRCNTTGYCSSFFFDTFPFDRATRQFDSLNWCVDNFSPKHNESTMRRNAPNKRDGSRSKIALCRVIKRKFELNDKSDEISSGKESFFMFSIVWNLMSSPVDPAGLWYQISGIRGRKIAGLISAHNERDEGDLQARMSASKWRRRLNTSCKSWRETWRGKKNGKKST